RRAAERRHDAHRSRHVQGHARHPDGVFEEPSARTLLASRKLYGQDVDRRRLEGRKEGQEEALHDLERCRPCRDEQGSRRPSRVVYDTAWAPTSLFVSAWSATFQIM